uniref:NADH-ubiquinone oxidoreductase chain 6 n=1 Tax=Solemya velum TaxID=13268 RepID=H9TB10_SOLVE|nr:NADH dehydrogenase subunit 6 [Solemya velum]AFG18174.1 NADH dehydrogenase subunit 6 [Solemya velum]AGI98163.1 NADH dehydrogenase subunit 6 [Solemya velum]
MMVLIIFSSLVSSIAFIMPSMMQPLSLGLNIMVLSVFSCLLVGFEMSSWYGYIMFLIYVGGLLVMFSYVAALTPNSFFSGVSNLLLFFLSLVVFFSTYMFNWFSSSTKFVSADMKMTFVNEGSSGSLMCSNYNFGVLVFLGVILFLALVAVVKICFSQKAPLRPFG